MHAITHFLARHKEFLTTALAVVAALFFLSYFGQDETINPVLRSLVVAIATFLVVPILYCKIVLERPLGALGFQRGNPWAGIGGGVVALGVALVALFVLWNFTPLLEGYHLPGIVREQFLFFVLYELVLSTSFLLLFEVFFRGFVMLLWLRGMGIWGVFVQAGLFIGLFWISGSIEAQTIPLLLFAPFAGLIAYQSRSIWYSLGTGWFFLLMVDTLVLFLR